MPRLIVTKRAALGIGRCRQFLARQSPEAASRAAWAIEQCLLKLETSPLLGRPVIGGHAMRELPILFGTSGYVALYRHDPDKDVVHILAFRHQREAGC
ncbi:type II toxin-antitoxin system RelE/ParE family toxin [Rhizobium sp. AQ_MP]|uniref:type II toxin-antitoxin system RelE/ParE family toxin n=1 Tax=Rhizobium sp. AQ_MP TaxID=2761536 RepID=UPI00163A4E24|nr:type II toxin-antitoxin system RelE/ParE family toxin [Rhizobium sp. AQ_MP]